MLSPEMAIRPSRKRQSQIREGPTVTSDQPTENTLRDIQASQKDSAGGGHPEQRCDRDPQGGKFVERTSPAAPAPPPTVRRGSTLWPLSQQGVAVVSLSLATLWWLLGLAHSQPAVGGIASTLSEALLVVLVCFGVRLAVETLIPKKAILSSLVLTHYLQGLLVFVTYVVAFCLEPEWFAKNWQAIYFGYYIYDIATILLYWRKLFSSFRVFYAIHHTVSFGITGLWMLVGGEWLDYIVLGVVIWLGSDLWLYAMSTYRCFHGKRLSANGIQRLRIVVFWIERVHRLAAYVVPWVIADFQLSNFALLVLGTGLANDVLDVVFQWRSIGRKRRRLSGSEPGSPRTGKTTPRLPRRSLRPHTGSASLRSG